MLKPMLSQEEHPLKVRWVTLPYRRESSHCCLYKQVNFISITNSPPLLVGANPAGTSPWLHLDQLRSFSILKLGAIVFSQVKTHR